MNQERDQGFSLIEVLVAVTILALVIGPMLYSFVTAAQINSRSKRYMEASAAAQNAMEKIKAGTFDELGFTDHNDGTYTRDTVEIINGQTFHVKAKLDANSYKRVLETEPEQYNDQSLPDIYRMDKAKDALYIQNEDMDEQAAISFFEDSSAFSQMKRKMVLYIKEDGYQKPEVTLDIAYEYNGISRYQEKGTVLFRNTSNQKTLHSIYLFFQPMYNNLSGIKEELFIVNDAKVPIEVYLVKQENSKTNQGAERTYQVKTDVAETDYAGESNGEWIPLTRIKTNLTDSQVVMTYNGDAEKPVGGEGLPAEVLVGKQTLSGEVKKERIYEIEVEVLDEKGETKAVLTGTKER